MSRRFGFELLADQTADAVAAEMAEFCAFAENDARSGDSPIERLLSAAIYARTRYFVEEWGWKIRFVESGHAEQMKGAPNAAHFLIMERQVVLEGVGRVDFVIHAKADWAREPEGGVPGWRRLVIECDGHDFHERTKQQVAKDRSRDRATALSGVEVFRFTGSELWRDPWGCAGQIIEWANRGV